MYFRRTRHSQLQFGFVTGSPKKSPKKRVIYKGYFTFLRPLFYLLQNRLHLFAFFRRAQSKRGAPDTRHAQRGRRLLLSSARFVLVFARLCLAMSSPKKIPHASRNFFSSLSRIPLFFPKKKQQPSAKKKAHICLIHISSVTQTYDFPNSQHTGKQISHLAWILASSCNIPFPVKTSRVFPNPAPYFGQIQDPENTLPDPPCSVSCSGNSGKIN